MIQTVEDLTQCANQLPPDQRFTLAQRILTSVETQENEETDSAWASEIRARIARYDSGETKGIPGTEVFAKIDRRLAK